MKNLNLRELLRFRLVRAIRAIDLLHPEYVIPGHYNTFPVIQQDVEAWSAKVQTGTSAKPVVLSPGQSFTV